MQIINAVSLSFCLIAFIYYKFTVNKFVPVPKWLLQMHRFHLGQGLSKSDTVVTPPDKI